MTSVEDFKHYAHVANFGEYVDLFSELVLGLEGFVEVTNNSGQNLNYNGYGEKSVFSLRIVHRDQMTELALKKFDEDLGSSNCDHLVIGVKQIDRMENRALEALIENISQYDGAGIGRKLYDEGGNVWHYHKVPTQDIAQLFEFNLEGAVT
jgi:hypothetical protein